MSDHFPRQVRAPSMVRLPGGSKWAALAPLERTRDDARGRRAVYVGGRVSMSDEIEFIESRSSPICPHCEATLDQVEYRRQKLSFGLMGGFSWVILLTCPRCHKVLGAQTWD